MMTEDMTSLEFNSNSTIQDLHIMLNATHLTLTLYCITKKDVAVCGKEARLAPDTLGP